MIRLLFVGDGDRDAVTVPPLVGRMLNAEIDPTTKNWRAERGSKRKYIRVHGARKGYESKLLYVIRQARDAGVDGVVATVDADTEKKGKRLRALKKGREKDRESNPTLPTAVGEARPHGEAWLLADSVAVREGLSLPVDTHIPTVRQADSPKRTLNDLISQSPRAVDGQMQALGSIARCVDPSRCTHKRETGFGAFLDEVRTELGPLTAGAPST